HLTCASARLALVPAKAAAPTPAAPFDRKPRLLTEACALPSAALSPRWRFIDFLSICNPPEAHAFRRARSSTSRTARSSHERRRMRKSSQSNLSASSGQSAGPPGRLCSLPLTTSPKTAVGKARGRRTLSASEQALDPADQHGNGQGKGGNR